MAAILSRPQWVKSCPNANERNLKDIFKSVATSPSQKHNNACTVRVCLVIYLQVANISRAKSQHLKILVLSCGVLCRIRWSQMSNREWRCSWSSADRRCSNYIWVIDNFIAYKGATYIRGFTVLLSRFSYHMSDEIKTAKKARKIAKIEFQEACRSGTQQEKEKTKTAYMGTQELVRSLI